MSSISHELWSRDMLKPIIEVKNLSKGYSLGQIGISTLKEDFQRLFDRFGRIGEKKPHRDKEETFWALKDISFDVAPGQVLGIIGRNGAGKSTLLKILSKITEPTGGEVILRGRVASLLEVGTGFHGDLSGRENIYLNGAILGMTVAEIRKKFDEIVAFAEIDKFLDTPVKRYSSGMYVRLAFAIAAHLEPEILIVDEVLAVGDQQFQKKCLGKMKDVSSREGRTVLLVSHTMSVILQLAQTCLVLDGGRVRYHGAPAKAVEMYLNANAAHSSVVFNVEDSPRTVDGNLSARLIELRFPRAIPIFEAHDDFEFVARIRARDRIENARVSMVIFASEGTPIGACFSEGVLHLTPGEEVEVEVSLSNPGLAPGAYYCGVAIGKGSHKTGHIDFDVVTETLHFEVCAAPGEDTAVSHWCPQWGRIVFKDLSVRQSSAQEARI